jgi:hypothetical protein
MNPNLSLNLSINRNHPNNKTIEIPLEFSEDLQQQKQYKHLKDKFLFIISNLDVGDKSRKHLNALVSIQDQMASILSSTPDKNQSTHP